MAGGVRLDHDPFAAGAFIRLTSAERPTECLRMPNLTPDFTAGSTSRGNRRRYAAVLIAAWAVFWLVLVGQPCCEALALTPGHTESQAIADASQLSVHAQPGDHGADSHPGCPDVTAAAFDALSSTATPTAVDQPLVAIPPPRVAAPIPTRGSRSLKQEFYGTPPPLIALYLRNLHLLI